MQGCRTHIARFGDGFRLKCIFQRFLIAFLFFISFDDAIAQKKDCPYVLQIRIIKAESQRFVGQKNSPIEGVQVTPGGNPYSGILEFFNKQSGKNENITLEIQNEKNNHLVCYQVSSLSMKPSSGLSILAADKDDKSLPIGLSTTWTTKAIDFGDIWVRLKHQPNSKTGSCDIGETDVEVAFPYVIR